MADQDWRERQEYERKHQKEMAAIRKQLEQKQEQFRKEYDERQREKNQVLLTECGARYQPMKDKIFLCNDDSMKDRIDLNELGCYSGDEVNQWKALVL